MSFILDALRKSETERQHKGSAEFANVPTSSEGRRGPPAWLWVLGVLLLINFGVLVGILLRPEVRPAPEPAESTAVPAPKTEPEPEPAAADDFASRVAAARENAPRREAPVVAASDDPPMAVEPAAKAATSSSFATLPTIFEVQAQGLVSLPDLHVDIHVYSESPGDRFVFINMSKHNEGSRLSEGPLVEEITPDGVVLSHDGMTFLLPRD